MKKTFKLMSAALLALAAVVPAQAETLTVFDGTATSTSVPIEGYYYDGVGCAVQTIIPAADVAAMEGAFINSMKFYIADEGGNKLEGGSMKVSVGTTDKTTFSSYDALIEGLTHVADITMTAGETEVVVNFDTPFNYQGGNLVIEMLVESRGNYAYVNFYGVNAEVSNALLKHNYSNSVDAFYPKTTFEYEAVEDMAAVSTREVAFGTVYLGNEVAQTITLKNLGKNAFTPVFGTLEAPFSLDVAAGELASGASMDLTVKFAAAEVGDYSQTLTIDCGAAGQFDVSVTGVAAEAPLEVVVCDGDATNASLPVYGYYYDMSNAKSQMVYTAEMLSDLVGKKVSQVTFHPTAPLNIYDGVLQLSFKIVEQNGFTDYTPIEELTVVGTAVPVKGDTELTFALDEPFEYTGGNLAIETLNIETGYYGHDSYYGVEVEGYYPSFYAYGVNGSTDVSEFLPKVTFTYEKSGEEPEALRGDVNGDNQVSIEDVTVLIDYLLGTDVQVTEGADCNLDGKMSIEDVTVLIDYLLGTGWPAE